MVAIVPLFRELERQGRAGSTAEAPPLVRQAGLELDRIKDFLERHLKALEQPRT
jgi:hypothetical protein